MKKQLSVGIAVENPNDIDDFTTVIYLPSKDHEIQDAFHQVRIESPDTYREYTITQCKMFPGLEYARLDSPSIEELNFFAQRLDSLNKEEQLVFRAVAPKHISTDEDAIVSVKDLINLTYGLDGVMIASNVENVSDLGQFVIDNELNEIVFDTPEEVLPYLDKRIIGQLQQEVDGGVFLDGKYIVAGAYELREIYDGQHLPNEDSSSRYAFRLEVGRPPVSDADVDNAIGTAQWIDLPIDKDKANAIAQEYGKERIEDCVYFGFESTVPQIERDEFGDMQDFDKLNNLSQMLLEMTPSDQAKFKAVLSAESPSKIEDILDIARNLHQYKFSTQVEDSSQFFKTYMLRHMDTRFDPKWLDSLSCYKEGDRLLQRLGATVTDYGIISKRCGGLYETITHDVPEENPLLTERFELVEVNGQTALFTEDRITASDVPDGLFKYDLRSGETMDYASIETNVMVNHAATILVKKPFDFGGLDYIPLNDDTSPNFLGDEVTIGEYMDTDYDQEEEITIKMGGM